MMLIVTSVVAVLLIAIAVAFWWIFPRWQIKRYYSGLTKLEDIASTEDEFRRTITQALGGIGLIGGLLLTAQQIQTSKETTTAQIRSSEESSGNQVTALNNQIAANIKDNHAKLISDQFND